MRGAEAAEVVLGDGAGAVGTDCAVTSATRVVTNPKVKHAQSIAPLPGAFLASGP